MYYPVDIRDPSDDEEAEFGENGAQLSDHKYEGYKRRRSGFQFQRVCMYLSLALNVFLLATKLRPGLPKTEIARSQYASLAWNVPTKIGLLQGSSDEQEEDRIWDVETNFDRGAVALDDVYVESRGLPKSQRFPWDPSKGMYVINAYHNLHCMRLIRTSLVEYHRDKPQSVPRAHVVHCLHVIKDDIHCNADDLPRYTGMDQPNRKTGIGQTRICRDWSKLEKWADEHNACWKYVNGTDPDFNELDRYRYCPAGSPYMEMSKMQWPDDDEDETAKNKNA